MTKPTTPKPPTTALTPSQRVWLRGQVQNTPPSLFLGREGITPGVLAEIAVLLERRELIKIRFPTLPRREREEMAVALAEKAHAELCGQLGHTASYYRQHPEADKRRIRLPV